MTTHEVNRLRLKALGNEESLILIRFPHLIGVQIGTRAFRGHDRYTLQPVARRPKPLLPSAT